MKDKHAVVTGAGQGIGAAIAARLDEMGVRLTLMGRTLEPLHRGAAGYKRAQAVGVDVTDEASVAAAFAQARAGFGPIGILINNAGAAESARLDQMESAMWRRMLDVNLTGIFHCTRCVLKDMRELGWGRIINVASTAGVKGYAYVTAYCAAKHGAVGLTRALAMETARDGITVNALCPGYTNTDLLDQSMARIMQQTKLSKADVEKRLKSENPQQRFVEPDEVAAAVAWLCLPGSESITGQAIVIAGGEVMP